MYAMAWLMAGLGLGMGVMTLADWLRRWDGDRRLARQLAAGRHAAGAGAPPRDRLDEELAARAGLEEVPPVTADPYAAVYARPSRMLPPELAPLPMWDGNGQRHGRHEVNGMVLA
jgi:hypothetical protein